MAPGPADFALVLALAIILSAITWRAYRQWGLSQVFLVLLVFDVYLGAVELPSRLSERAVVVGGQWLTIRVGRWFDPVNIYLPLAEVTIIYEVERSRGWLAAETFWLFQDQRFRRKRLHLPALLKRHREKLVAFLQAQGIAFQVDHSVQAGDAWVVDDSALRD